VMLSVCAALRACHHVGIIHRDLKPANIFLCDTDTGWEVKVLDFGISKAPATDELTQDGQIIGTPQYLSPEQIEGTVGPESDQYALGVLMYVALTGRLPYAGYQSIRLLRAISEGTFDPPRTLRADLPEALEAIVLRAMHISPKRRFESIHALGQKLWDFASPRGQAQWKTFYFHTPAASQPAKHHTSTNPPELRELARERDKVAAAAAAPAPTPAPATAAPTPPVTGTPQRSDASPRLIDSAASLEPVEPFAKTEPAQDTIGPSHFATTKTAAASGVGEPTSASQSDIAGESALSEPQNPGEPARLARARRWRIALVVGGVACLGIVVAQQPWRTSGSPAQVTAGATARSTAATPPPTSAPSPAAPTTAAVVTPPRAAAPAVAPIEPPIKAPPAPPPEAPRKKHATRQRKAPKLDQHGIGIPTE